MSSAPIAFTIVEVFAKESEAPAFILWLIKG